jgi:hypothetical protein
MTGTRKIQKNLGFRGHAPAGHTKKLSILAAAGSEGRDGALIGRVITLHRQAPSVGAARHTRSEGLWLVS